MNFIFGNCFWGICCMVRADFIFSQGRGGYTSKENTYLYYYILERMKRTYVQRDLIGMIDALQVYLFINMIFFSFEKKKELKKLKLISYVGNLISLLILEKFNFVFSSETFKNYPLR
uniref:Uncharacterized protein n=1 Tax=Cacopsylla melanoneura TaxID=428564 RepID=A0A8D9AXX9_9HEMI